MIDDLRESAFKNRRVTKMALYIMDKDKAGKVVLKKSTCDDEGVEKVSILPNPFDKTKPFDTSIFPEYPVLRMERQLPKQKGDTIYEVVVKDEDGNYDCPQLWCFFRDANFSFPYAYEGSGKKHFNELMKEMMRISDKKNLKTQMISRLERFVEGFSQYLFPPYDSKVTDEKLDLYGMTYLPGDEGTCPGSHLRIEWCTAVRVLVRLKHNECRTILRESFSKIEADKADEERLRQKAAVQYEQDEVRRVISHNLSAKLKAEREECSEKELQLQKAELTQRVATREAKEQAMKEEELMAEREKACIAKERAKRKQQHKEEERYEKFGKKKKSD